MKFWKNPEYKAAFTHARLATAHYSKSFYMSSLMLPPKRRWPTFALYGFCRHVDNLVDNPRNRSQEELVNEIRALEQEIHIAYRTGESEHPVIRSFIIAAVNYNIPKEYPLDLLKGVQMDIQNQTKAVICRFLYCALLMWWDGAWLCHSEYSAMWIWKPLSKPAMTGFIHVPESGSGALRMKRKPPPNWRFRRPKMRWKLPIFCRRMWI